MKRKFNFRKFIKDYIVSISLLAIVVGFAVVFLPTTVIGNSMQNTLMNGDYAFAVRDWLVPEYEAGDIVIVAADCVNEGKPIVKRIIATEGQTIDIDLNTGVVTVDGVILDEPYITGSMIGRGTAKFPMTVEAGHVFVMGDNRTVSYDSRFESVGQIPVEGILGRLAFLAFPGNAETGRDYSRIGIIS